MTETQQVGTPLQATLPSHRILSVAEEELTRIVLDIHDGPVQYLFSALSLLTGAQNDLAESDIAPETRARLAQVGMLLESSLYEIKYFLGTFRPPEFRRRPLASIVEGLVIQHEEWTGATVHLETDSVPQEIPLAIKIALYRVLQEALSNANRHAGVVEHWVRLWGEPGQICMEVADDGRGFVPPDLESPLETDHADHIGLLGMRDRVALLSGAFRIESSPGHGAKITVTIPLDQPDVSLFTANELTANELTANELTANELTANELTANELTANEHDHTIA